jgi:hypothetical protein
MQRRSNGSRINLQQAIALLIQNEAALLSRQSQTDERQAQADERFRRIERELDEIKAILLRHERILGELPDVIRQKIGYKTR